MITYEEYKKRFNLKNRYPEIDEEIFNILNTEDNFSCIFENFYASVLFHPIAVGISDALISKAEADKNIKREDINVNGVLHDRIKSYKEIGHKFKQIILEYKDKPLSFDLKYEQTKPKKEDISFFYDHFQKGFVNRILNQKDQFEDFYEAVNTEMGQKLFYMINKERGNILSSIWNDKKTNTAYLDIVREIKNNWTLKIKSYETAVTTLKLAVFNLRRNKNAKT